MQFQLSTSQAITIASTGASLTYEELRDQSQRFIGALRSLGIKEGERVAFLLGNQLEYPVILRGAQQGGHDHLPLNTHSPDELRALILQFKPVAVVVSAEHIELAEKLNIEQETVPHWIAISKSRNSGWYSYYSLLEQAHTCETSPVRGKLLLLSGGSTGCPKIVARPHANAVDTPRQSVALAHVPHAPQSVILVSAPLYHTGPLGWLLGGLAVGAHVVLMERWDGLAQLEAVQRFKVTIMPIVPTMMSRLLEIPPAVRGTFDLSSLQIVSHSAAPCSVELKKRFMEWLPQLWSGYSMSEGFGLTVIGPEEWRKHPGSVGKAVPWCKITIRDERGNELPSGNIGTVWFHRHDGARMHYLDNQEETETSYNAQGEGTAYDLGYLDEDGYLYLTGRSKNMLIVGGVNVYPSAIENVLNSHPAVTEAIVVGVAHEDLGEVPCAVVEKTGDHAGSSELEQDLQTYCYEQLGRLAIPKSVIFVERLPRTPTGKVRMNDIRALVTA